MVNIVVKELWQWIESKESRTYNLGGLISALWSVFLKQPALYIILLPSW